MKAANTNVVRRRILLCSSALLLGALSPIARTQAVRRVIAIGGALVETIYALDAQNGARSALVATDTTSTYPEAAQRLPKVGYQRALSAEGLLSLHPDLILASTEAGPPGVLTQVRQAGVEVLSFPERHDAETVRRKITGIAEILGVGARGKALLTRFDDAWQHAQAIVEASRLTRRQQQPRVLFVFSHAGNQAFVAGRKTAADAMLGYAGVCNVMQGFNGYRPLSAEALVTAAPDIVLTTDESCTAVGGAAALLAMQGFAATPAGKSKRLVSMDALFMLGFGPRLPDAVMILNRRLATA